MFHVYGVGGRVHGGSGAQNTPVSPVQRLERIDSVHVFMADERPDTPDQPGGKPRNILAQDAMAAYAQAGQDVPTRTPQRVETVMARQVVTVQADATLADASAWMQEHAVGQAPVLDERQQLVGLLGRAQFMAAGAAGDARVADHMVSPVTAAIPATEVRRAARVMLDTGLPGLPVVDTEGALVGFVARGDLLRVLADEPALDTWT